MELEEAAQTQERGAAVGGRVERALAEMARERLVKRAQGRGRAASSDKTRTGEVGWTGALSNGSSPVRGQRKTAKTRASPSGSGLEEGSST